jgi:hypothetical protein
MPVRMHVLRGYADVDDCRPRHAGFFYEKHFNAAQNWKQIGRIANVLAPMLILEDYIRQKTWPDISGQAD